MILLVRYFGLFAPLALCGKGSNFRCRRLAARAGTNNIDRIIINCALAIVIHTHTHSHTPHTHFLSSSLVRLSPFPSHSPCLAGIRLYQQALASLLSFPSFCSLFFFSLTHSHQNTPRQLPSLSVLLGQKPLLNVLFISLFFSSILSHFHFWFL